MSDNRPRHGTSQALAPALADYRTPFAGDLLARDVGIVAPGFIGYGADADMRTPSVRVLSYARALPALRRLGDLKGNGLDEAVTQFVSRYGLLPLEESGSPPWEEIVDGVAFYPLPQSTAVYGELGRFITAVLVIAANERRGRRVSAGALCDFAGPLQRWSTRLEALEKDRRVRAGPSSIVHAGSVADEILGRFAHERDRSSPVDCELTNLPVIGCNAWLAAGRVQPYLAFGANVRGGSDGILRVRWSGGVWGAIGAQLVEALRGASTSEIRCSYCDEIIHRRQRRPKAGSPACCGSDACNKERARLYKRAERSRRQSRCGPGI